MSEGALSDRVARFLLQYRNTPHLTTGMIPAELLMGRKLRSRLDLVRPSLDERVQDKQEQQHHQHNCHARHRTFVEGERVYVKNHRSGDSWLPGEIDKATGPVSYMVRMAGGNTIRCHQDHIQSRIAEEPQSSTLPSEDIDDIASQISEDPSPLGFNVSPAVTCESVAETTEPE